MNTEPSYNFNAPHTNYYTPYQLFLPVNLSIIIDPNDLVVTFDEVFRRINLKKYLVSSALKDKRGRRGYNPVTLLEVVLFGFALKGYVSTRELADLCVNDIRFRWLLRYENDFPSHMTLCNFMNSYLKDSIDKIFAEINKYIFNIDNVDINHLYIDGTKLEANANKYTWVWKKACITNRDKLFSKISSEIDLVNEDLLSLGMRIEKKNEYEIDYLENLLQKLVSIFDIDTNSFVNGKGCKKSNYQKYYEFFNIAIRRLKDYSYKISECGEIRNSYSKTDKDATFMRIKTDYMGNDQLLPAYNIQFGICDEYISVLDVNQRCNDQDCFIPLMENYNKIYNHYPEFAVADAGYGSLKNYDFCQIKNIKKFMKFPTFEKETTNSKYHNDPFRPVNFKINSNGKLVCPNNKEFTKIKDKPIKGNNYGRTEEVYQCSNCKRCKFKSKCHKSKENRIIHINKTLTAYHQEVIHNLNSTHGALLLMNRSIMSEGTFGVIKQDKFYKRIVRKGLDSVTLEIYLVSIGFNIYKLHNKLHRK